MDDLAQHRHRTRIVSMRLLLVVGLVSMVWGLGGCSLFVMAGKMVFGDPTQDAAFRTVTGVDLTKGKHSVLVVASTPQTVKQHMPSADLVVTEQVCRLLDNRGIEIFPSRDVLNWVDDRGGNWGTPQELATAFPECDYVVEIDIDEMTFREENSPDLFRGNVSGNISAYEVIGEPDARTASPVFSQTFKSTYPTMYPKQAHQITEATFQKEFLDRVCTQISQSFYDYHARDAVH